MRHHWGSVQLTFPEVEPALIKCAKVFPPPWCFPPPASSSRDTAVTTRKGSRFHSTAFSLGDLIWLFFMERMGIFKMLGAILDDYAIRRKFPFATDNLQAMILESMTRQTKVGLSSTVRDRDVSYRNCLGWTSDVGKKVAGNTAVNNGFNTNFHTVLRLALELYRDRRLAARHSDRCLLVQRHGDQQSDLPRPQDEEEDHLHRRLPATAPHRTNHRCAVARGQRH